MSLGIVAALLCSCAATSVKYTWKSPEFNHPISKFAVLAVDDRVLLRQGFENRLVAELQSKGVTAITTFDLLSLSEINRDKLAAAERLRSAGCQGVVILRLMDVSTFHREIRPGNQSYAEVITGSHPGPWYDYYSLAYMDMSPTYDTLKMRVYLETSVFDLKTAKRVWSGLSETKVTETMDRLAEMDPIVGKFVAAMHKDGIISQSKYVTAP